MHPGSYSRACPDFLGAPWNASCTPGTPVWPLYLPCRLAAKLMYNCLLCDMYAPLLQPDAMVVPCVRQQHAAGAGQSHSRWNQQAFSKLLAKPLSKIKQYFISRWNQRAFSKLIAKP